MCISVEEGKYINTDGFFAVLYLFSVLIELIELIVRLVYNVFKRSNRAITH
jgi:hypothetical protein